MVCMGLIISTGCACCRLERGHIGVTEKSSESKPTTLESFLSHNKIIKIAGQTLISYRQKIRYENNISKVSKTTIK